MKSLFVVLTVALVVLTIGLVLTIAVVLLELVFLREFRTVLVVVLTVFLAVLTIRLMLTIAVVLLELVFLREFRAVLVVVLTIFLIVLAVRLVLTVVVVLVVVLIVHDFHLLSKFGGMLANFFLLHILKILAFAFDQGFLVIGAQLVSHLILVIVLAFPGRTLILAFTIIHHFSHLNNSMAVFVQRHSEKASARVWEEMEKDRDALAPGQLNRFSAQNRSSSCGVAGVTTTVSIFSRHSSIKASKSQPASIFSAFSGCGLVTGFFGVKIVQQSSNGRIDVS